MEDNVTFSTFEFFEIFPDQSQARMYLEEQRWTACRTPSAPSAWARMCDHGPEGQAPGLLQVPRLRPTY